MRNYSLAILGSMAGLFLGSGILLLLADVLPLIFLILMLFVGFPVGFAIAAVHAFGVNRKHECH